MLCSLYKLVNLSIILILYSFYSFMATMLNGISPRGDRGKFMTMFVVEETASTYSLINRGGICKMHFVTITNLE